MRFSKQQIRINIVICILDEPSFEVAHILKYWQSNLKQILFPKIKDFYDKNSQVIIGLDILLLSVSSTNPLK